jgi:hypothetical protein
VGIRKHTDFVVVDESTVLDLLCTEFGAGSEVDSVAHGEIRTNFRGSGRFNVTLAALLELAASVTLNRPNVNTLF